MHQIPVEKRGRWVVRRALVVGVAVGVAAGAKALFLYFAGVYLYLVVVFGALFASVNLLILRSVADAGARGLPEKTFAKRYSRRTLLGQRIRYLVGNGDIAVSGRRYRLANRWSLFFLHEKAIEFVAALSGLKTYG